MRALVYYFVLIAPFLVLLAFLGLQVSALARYRHGSFLLLAIGSGCGLLYVLGQYAAVYLRSNGEVPPDSLFYASALFLLGQMIVGLWGTAWLFRSYGQKSAELTGQRRPSSDA